MKFELVDMFVVNEGGEGAAEGEGVEEKEIFCIIDTKVVLICIF